MVLSIGLAIISGLKINRREKYAMLFVTLVGLISIVSTLIRFSLCYEIAIGSGNGSLDLVHSVNTWSVMEVFMSHTAFSLLAFKAALNNWRRAKEAPRNALSSFLNKKNKAETMGSLKSEGRGIHITTTLDLQSARRGSQSSQVELNGVFADPSSSG